MHFSKARSIAFNSCLLLAAALFITQPVCSSGPTQEGYPPPMEATAESILPEIVPTEALPGSYPPAGLGTDGFSPVPIGSDAGQEATDSSTNDRQQAQIGNNQGLLFLWLSFLATFFIFLTSIIGAIVLFTRRNEG